MLTAKCCWPNACRSNSFGPNVVGQMSVSQIVLDQKAWIPGGGQTYVCWAKVGAKYDFENKCFGSCTEGIIKGYRSLNQENIYKLVYSCNLS